MRGSLNTMTTLHKPMLALLALFLVTGFTGCQHAPLDTGSVFPATGGGAGQLPPNPTFTPSDLEVIYFDYNSYSLRPDALAALKRNADKIKGQGEVVVQIEGHCDERGTQEYNLALGEKRALSIREYLINLGVSGDRLVTISYGEEQPQDSGHAEAAWAKNRRSQFNKAQ